MWFEVKKLFEKMDVDVRRSYKIVWKMWLSWLKKI